MRFCSPRYWRFEAFILVAEIVISVLALIGGLWLSMWLIDWMTMAFLDAGIHL